MRRNEKSGRLHKARHARAEKKFDGNGCGDEEVLLQWSVHAARSNPLKAAAAIIAVAVTVLIGYLLTGSWLFGLVGGFILICMLSDFLFPVRYCLTNRRANVISILSWRSIEWKQVKSCYIGEDGVVLSPFEVRTPLEPFRSLLLRFNGNADEVIELVNKLARWRSKP